MNLDPKPIVDETPAEPVAAPVVVGIPISDEFVERVNQMTPGEISPENIRAVLAAVNHATVGDAVGTVRLSETGEMAYRISLNGVDQWQITKPSTGESWYDLSPTLAWPRIGGQ